MEEETNNMIDEQNHYLSVIRKKLDKKEIQMLDDAIEIERELTLKENQ